MEVFFLQNHYLTPQNVVKSGADEAIFAENDFFTCIYYIFVSTTNVWKRPNVTQYTHLDDFITARAMLALQALC